MCGVDDQPNWFRDLIYAIENIIECSFQHVFDV